MKTAEEYLRENLIEYPKHEEYNQDAIDAIACFMDGYAKYYHEQQVNSVDLADVVGQSEQLKAVEKLKDFAYEVCPLHREDDLEEIVCSL